MTDRAEQGASVEAMVGQMTTGISRAFGDAFASVEAFAASDRDQAVEGCVLRLQTGGGALDFGVGAFASEDLDGSLDLHGAQAVQQLVAVTAQAARADVDGGPGAGDY